MKRKWTTDISSTSGSFHLNFEAPTPTTTTTTTKDAPDATPTTISIQQPQHTEEINALTSLAQSTQLLNWTTATNWLSEAPLSEWHGVTTHSETGRVTGLALPNNNLVGDMSDVIVAVSTLTKLTQLNLYNNSLCGCKTTGMLELAEQLVLFDYSGNEMTTFYRAPVAAETKDAVVNAGILATSKQLCTTATTTATTTSSSPLLAVNSTPHILQPSQCATIISLSEQYATSHGGWSTDRHSAYKTTDLDVRNVASLLDVCNACLKATILPTVSRLYDLPSAHCLEVDDLFVVKYEWDKQGQHQTSLPAHRDDSVLSFVIALNQDYKGGGTVFVDHRPVFVAAPTEVGTLVSFCGVQRHGGRAITQGIRYILAGFLNVHDEGGVLRKEAEVLYPLVEGEGLP